MASLLKITERSSSENPCVLTGLNIGLPKEQRFVPTEPIFLDDLSFDGRTLGFYTPLYRSPVKTSFALGAWAKHRREQEVEVDVHPWEEQ